MKITYKCDEKQIRTLHEKVTINCTIKINLNVTNELIQEVPILWFKDDIWPTYILDKDLYML